MGDSGAESAVQTKSRLLIEDVYEFSRAASGLSAVDAEFDASEVIDYLL